MGRLALITMFFMVGVGGTRAWASACLLDYPAPAKTCAQYTSQIPQILDLMQQSCKSNPYGKWIDECPGHYGCKLDQVQIVTTTWYQNGESEATITQACQFIGGILVVK